MNSVNAPTTGGGGILGSIHWVTLECRGYQVIEQGGFTKLGKLVVIHSDTIRPASTRHGRRQRCMQARPSPWDITTHCKRTRAVRRLPKRIGGRQRCCRVSPPRRQPTGATRPAAGCKDSASATCGPTADSICTQWPLSTVNVLGLMNEYMARSKGRQLDIECPSNLADSSICPFLMPYWQLIEMVTTYSPVRH